MVSYFDSPRTRRVYGDFEMYFPLIAQKAEEFNDIGLGEYEAVCDGLSDEKARCIFIYDDLDKTLRRKQYLYSSDLTSEQWAKEFGYKLNRAMRMACLSQEELASELDISRQTLSKYINGKAIPNYLVMMKMAEVLRCDIDVLANF